MHVMYLRGVEKKEHFGLQITSCARNKRKFVDDFKRKLFFSRIYFIVSKYFSFGFALILSLLFSLTPIRFSLSLLYVAIHRAINIDYII